MCNKPAQGNALGKVSERESPERATERRAPIVPPFQGSPPRRSSTQSVALGWLVGGPLALKSSHAGSEFGGEVVALAHAFHKRGEQGDDALDIAQIDHLDDAVHVAQRQ